MQATLILTIGNFPLKFPPYIIFKNTSAKDNDLVENPYEDQIILRQNKTGWINEEILKDYLERLIFNLKFSPDYQIHLILDRCKVHLKNTIIEKLQENQIKYSFVPSGATGFVQPLDVCINKPFKDCVRKYYKEWFQKEGIKKII